jgi:hypothetical protein
MKNNASMQMNRNQHSQRRFDWLLTQLAIVGVTLLLLLAAMIAFVFAVLPPHTDGGDIGP